MNRSQAFRCPSAQEGGETLHQVQIRVVPRDWVGGLRMGLYYYLSRINRTPAAQVAIAALQKIDRPFVLAGPAVVHDASAAFVDGEECPGGQKRVHGPILQADEAVTKLLGLTAVQK